MYPSRRHSHGLFHRVADLPGLAADFTGIRIYDVGIITYDAIDSGKRGFDIEEVSTYALLSFQRGCIFGSKYPERIEPMVRADKLETPGYFTWEDCVELTEQWLKDGKW